jgi:hypothetical protein
MVHVSPRAVATLDITHFHQWPQDMPEMDVWSDRLTALSRYNDDVLPYRQHVPPAIPTVDLAACYGTRPK